MIIVEAKMLERIEKVSELQCIHILCRGRKWQLKIEGTHGVQSKRFDGDSLGSVIQQFEEQL